jgi:hypothetical protein
LEDANTATRRLILDEGSLVILHPDGPAGGFPMIVAVDRVAHGQHWFLGNCDPIRRGEYLIVELPVPMDARYVTRGQMVAASSETFALEIESDWERVQQRAFIRISAHSLQVRVVRLASPSDTGQEPDADSIHDLVDISAGGIRFASVCDYEHGEEVVCHFELPGSLCFVIPARIVRNRLEGVAPLGKSGVAVEFVGLDENNRSQLLHWVYREQVRRHREKKREEDNS